MEIFDKLVVEQGVLGFEYGLPSVADQRPLTLWRLSWRFRQRGSSDRRTSLSRPAKRSGIKKSRLVMYCSRL